MVMSTRTIRGKLDRLAQEVRDRDQQRAGIIIETCWGNEAPRELPPNTVHIRTQWGTVRV